MTDGAGFPGFPDLASFLLLDLLNPKKQKGKQEWNIILLR